MAKVNKAIVLFLAVITLIFISGIVNVLAAQFIAPTPTSGATISSPLIVNVSSNPSDYSNTTINVYQYLPSTEYGITSQPDTGSSSTLEGMNVLIKSNTTLTKVIKNTNSTAPIAYLYAADATTLLASSNFSGNIAIFNYPLIANTTYNIFGGNDASPYTRSLSSVSPGLPRLGTLVNWNGYTYLSQPSSSPAYDINIVGLELTGQTIVSSYSSINISYAVSYNYTDSIGTSLTPDQNYTINYGMGFTMNADRALMAVNKTSDCTATTAYLYAQNAITLLDQANFTGDQAIFDNYTLHAGQSYNIMFGSNGVNYMRTISSLNPGLPINHQLINWTGYTFYGTSSPTTAYVINVKSMDFGNLSGIIQNSTYNPIVSNAFNLPEGIYTYNAFSYGNSSSFQNITETRNVTISEIVIQPIFPKDNITVITNATSVSAGYKIRQITGLNTSATISYITVPFETGMSTDFGDVRFAGPGGGFIPYYMENYNSGVSANFRVATYNQPYIYIFYNGSSNVTTSSLQSIYGSNIASAYLLDNSPGSTSTSDALGNGNTLSGLTGTFQSGLFGNGYNANNEFKSTGITASNLGTTHTVSLWFKQLSPSLWGSNYARMVASGASWQPGAWGVTTQGDGGSTLFYTAMYGGNSPTFGNIGDGKFHNVIMSVNYTSNKYQVYLDGVHVGIDYNTGGSDPTNIFYLFGAQGNSLTSGTAVLNDIMLFNATLTDVQIATLSSVSSPTITIGNELPNIPVYYVNFTANITSISGTNLTNATLTVTRQGILAPCYQETANVSTTCGGVNTGVYGFTNPLMDGNHSTTWDTDGIYYFNYTKPTNAKLTSLFSSWRLSPGGVECPARQEIQTNISLPAGCWNYNPNKVVYRYFMNTTTYQDKFNRTGYNYARYAQCYDGSTWQTLDDASWSYSPSRIGFCYPYPIPFSDEAMIWDFGNTTDIIVNQTTVNLGGLVQTTVSVPVSLVDGFYNWFWSVWDSLGFNTQTSPSSQINLESTAPTINFYGSTPVDGANTSLNPIPIQILTGSNSANLTLNVWANQSLNFLPSGLISYHSFDNQAAFLTDEVNSSYNLIDDSSNTIQGTSFSKIGGGAVETMSNSTVPQRLAFTTSPFKLLADPSKTITVSMWQYTAQTNLGQAILFGTGADGNQAQNFGVVWYPVSWQTYGVVAGPSQWTFNQKAPHNFQGYTWNHVVLVMNQTHIKLYVNNSLEIDSPWASQGFPAFDFNGAPAYLFDGLNNDPDGRINFNTTLDEVAIWNRELSPAEISSLYSYTNPLLYTYNYSTTITPVIGINNFNIGVPSDGYYLFNALTSNSGGLTSSTETRKILVDTAAPQITDTYLVTTPYNALWADTFGAFGNWNNPGGIEFTATHDSTITSVSACGGNSIYFTDSTRAHVLYTTPRTGITTPTNFSIVAGTTYWALYSGDSGVQCYGGTFNGTGVYYPKYTQDVTYINGLNPTTGGVDSGNGGYGVYNMTTSETASVTNNPPAVASFNNVTFYAGFTDNFGIYNTSFTLNRNVTSYTYPFGTLNSSINMPMNLSDGTYVWWYNVSDWAGNTNLTLPFTTIVDSQSPVINITYPANNGFYNFSNSNLIASYYDLTPATLEFYSDYSTGIGSKWADDYGPNIGNWGQPGGMKINVSTSLNILVTDVAVGTSTTFPTLYITLNPHDIGNALGVASRTPGTNLFHFADPVKLIKGQEYWIMGVDIGNHQYGGTNPAGFGNTVNGIKWVIGFNPTTNGQDTGNGGYDITNITYVLNTEIILANQTWYNPSYLTSNPLTAYSSFNNGLAAYWNFDNPSGDVTDVISGKFNWTDVGGVGTNAGIINNSRGYTDATHSFSNNLGTLMPGDSDFTVSMWVNELSTSHYQTFFEGGMPCQSLSGNGFCFQGFDASQRNGYTIRDKNSTGAFVLNIQGAFGPNRVLNTWNLLTITKNSTYLTLYVNGNPVTGQEVTGFDNFNQSLYKMGAETPFGDGKYINALFDEMGIWNRSLSADEVSKLYNNGTGKTFSSTFTVHNLTSIPGNNTWTLTSTDLAGHLTVASTNFIQDFASPNITQISPIADILNPMNWSGTVAYFTLNDSVGPVAVNSIPWAVNGTYNNFNVQIGVPGKIGTAFQTIGGTSNSFNLNLGNGPLAGVGTSWTISYWVNRTFGCGSGGGAAYDFESNPGTGNQNRMIIDSCGDFESGQVGRYDGTGWASFGVSASPYGQWSHVVVSADGVNSRMYAMVNGVLSANISYSPKILSGGFNFGFFEEYGRQTYDEIAIFNRTLSPSEMTTLYNNGAARTYSTASITTPTTVYTNNSITNFTINATDNFGLGNATLTITAQNYEGQVAQNGLLHYYPFDSSGADIRGSNGISLTGPYVPGHIANAYNVNFNQNPNLGFSLADITVNNSFSYSVWYNQYGSPSPGSIIMGYPGFIPGYAALVPNGGNSIFMQFYDSIGYHNIYTNLNSGWNLLVVSFNGTDMHFNVNGRDQSMPANNFVPASNAFQLFGSNNNFYTTGYYVDDLRFYNHALSTTEINELYTGSIYRNTFNLGGLVQTTVTVPVGLLDGIFNWLWTVFDLAGNSAQTNINNTIIVDTTNPGIVFDNSITPQSGLNLSQTNFTIGAIVTDANPSSLTFNVWNSTWSNVTTVPLTYAMTSINPNLTHQYKFDETTNTTFYDTVGTTNLVGLTGNVIPGKIGNAYSMGSAYTGNASLGQTPTDIGQQITVSLWIRRTGDFYGVGTYPNILSTGGSANNWGLYGNADNHNGGFFMDGGNCPELSSTPLNTWIFVTMEWDFQNNICKLYLNNGTASQMSHTATFGGYPITLFSSPTNPAVAFARTMDVDDLRVYNKLLNITEIAAIYNNGVGSESAMSQPAITKNYVLPDGRYNYNATTLDIVNNFNTTETRQITLDTHAPNATILSPNNGTNETISNFTYYNYTNQTFILNATDNIALKNATLSISNNLSSISQLVLNGLQHYYPFNESSGAVAQDIIAGNNLTGLTGTFGPGKWANAYATSGQAIDSGFRLNQIYGANDAFSICFYVNRTGLMGLYNRYIGNDQAGGVGSNGQFSLYSEGPGQDSFTWYIKGTGALSIITSSSFSANTWTPYCAVFNGTTATLYESGIVVGTDTVTGFDSSAISDNIYVFGRTADGNKVVNVKTDDLRFYNRALNQSEVQTLMTGTGIVTNNYNANLGSLVTTVVSIPVNLADGLYSWFWSVYDWANNLFTTTTQQTVIDTINPNLSISYPATNTNYSNLVNNLTANINEQNPNTLTLIMVPFSYPTGADCYQETANVSTACGGLNTGTYAPTLTGVDGTVFINYTKPAAAFNATWEVKIGTAATQNITLPQACYNADSNKLSFKLYTKATGTPYSEADCWNGTSWTQVKNSTGGTVSGTNVGNPDLVYDGDWSTFACAGGTWLNGGSCAASSLYEEAIIWRMTSTIPTITIPLANMTWFDSNYLTSNPLLTMPNTFTITGIPATQGYNNWTLVATDQVNHITSTTNRFFVDSIYPTVALVPNSDPDGANIGHTYIIYNTTAFDVNLVTVDTKLFNSYNVQVGDSFRNATGQTFTYGGNFSGLVSGDYMMFATACDVVGNCKNSTVNTIHLDLGGPTVNFTAPTPLQNNLTTAYNITDIPVNVTVVDLYPNNVSLILTGPNGYNSTATEYFIQSNLTRLTQTTFNWSAYGGNNSDGNFTTFAVLNTTLTGVNKNITSYSSYNLTHTDLTPPNVLLSLNYATYASNSTTNITDVDADTFSMPAPCLTNVTQGLDLRYNVQYKTTCGLGNCVAFVIQCQNRANSQWIDAGLIDNFTQSTFTYDELKVFEESIAISDSNAFYNDFTNLSDGKYSLSAIAFDQVGNFQIINRTIYITGNVPTNMTYEPPTPLGGGITLNYIPINVSVVEPNMRQIVINLYTPNMSLYTSRNSSPYQNNLYYQFAVPDGQWFFNATAYDIYNNSASLSTIMVQKEYGAGNTTICKDLSFSGTYTLINDLNKSSGVCLTVMQPDTTIDCQGHSIIVTNGTPILTTQPRTTIKNCYLDAIGPAVNLTGGSLTLMNSTLTNSGYGLYAVGGATANVQTCTISNNGIGIYLNPASLTMSNTLISGSTTYGLLLNGNSHATTTDVIFQSNPYSIYQNNTVTSPGGASGSVVWGPSGAGSYTRTGFTGSSNIITLINSSYNTFSTLTSTSGNILYTLSTNNYMSSGTLAGAAVTLNNNSTANTFLDTTYSGTESVDNSSVLIRSWTTTVHVVDSGGSGVGGSTVHVNDGSNSTIATDQNGNGAGPVNEYINNGTITAFNPYNIFGVLTDYGNSLFTDTANVNVNTPTDVTLTFGQRIRSTLLTDQVMKVLLAVILLIGLAASTGFFVVKMRDGNSVVDIWKYFIIMIIWDVIFLVLFVVLSGYIMGHFYPPS